MVEMKNMKQEYPGKKTNAFMVEKNKQEWKCYGCGENGHFQRDCKNGGSQNKNGRQSRGQTGNWRGNQYGSRGNNFRGQQGHCSYAKHEGNKEEASAWLKKVDHVVYNSKLSSDSNENEWLLDSGCTDHIVNDEEYFDTCVTLKEPVNVYLGDSRCLEATKIGKVISYYRVFGKNSLVEINNVFLVKDMKSNLISLSGNHTIISKGKMTKIINNKKKIIAIALRMMKSKLKYGKSSVNIANKNTESMS